MDGGVSMARTRNRRFVSMSRKEIASRIEQQAARSGHDGWYLCYSCKSVPKYWYRVDFDRGEQVITNTYALCPQCAYRIAGRFGITGPWPIKAPQPIEWLWG